jgi:hypothetical protein
MRIRWNQEDDAEACISLNPANRKKIINYLGTRNNVQGISKDELENYRKGEKEFMPFPHFKAIIDEFGDDFLDLFFES